MASVQWTRAGLLELIGKQLEFLQRNKRKVEFGGRKGIWFGPQWVKPYHHWVRAQAESLHLIATYVAGARAGEIPGVEIGPLVEDLELGLLAACAAHCTDGALRFEHTKGLWGKGWQSAWWTYRLVRVLTLVGDLLSNEIKTQVRRVAEVECDRFIGVTPPTGVVDDTKAEENSWDAPVLAWSSFAFPDHPHAAAWEKAARLWALNAYAVALDKFDKRPMSDGKPMSAWVAGANLHPDFTCENHGTFHTNYQATVMENCVTASAYLVFGKPVPMEILHNVKEAAEVFAYFNASDTTQLMTTGNDWATYHGLHSCWPLIAHFCDDDRMAALAQANLSRYEKMIGQSDNGHIFGSTVASNIGEQGFFYHTGNSVMLADVYAVIPLGLKEKAGAVGFGGTRNWKYVEVVTQRDDVRLASMAWRTLYHHPLVTVLPLHGAGTTLAGWAPFTGIGRFVLASGETLMPRVLTHAETVTAGGFATSGVIEWLEKDTVLVRQELEVQARAGEAVLVKEMSVALVDFELAANEQWCFSLANDLHNGYVRKVKDQRGKVHAMKALLRKEHAVWAGFQVIVDDLIRYEADREITYFSPGKRLKSDNGFECTQFDRVMVKAGVGKFEKGDVVRTGVMRVEVL